MSQSSVKNVLAIPSDEYDETPLLSGVANSMSPLKVVESFQSGQDSSADCSKFIRRVQAFVDGLGHDLVVATVYTDSAAWLFTDECPAAILDAVAGVNMVGIVGGDAAVPEYHRRH